MKRAKLVFSGLILSGMAVLLASCATGGKKEPAEENAKPKSYSLVFYDEFDGDSLDPTKWECCPEWERQAGMKNHGWWADECVSVKDGNLVLECKKRESDGKFISGGVRTISKNYSRKFFSQQKGIWEIEFKVDKSSGFWYAFWMMANNNDQAVGNGAVNGAEIDMFELLPGNSGWRKNGRFMSTIHWDAYGSAHQSRGTDGISVEDFAPDFYDNWHVYKFVWTDEGYESYLDDTLLWKMEGNRYGGTCQAEGYTKITAEFGEWGGPVDPEILKGGSKAMYVDYVKIYKEE